MDSLTLDVNNLAKKLHHISQQISTVGNDFRNQLEGFLKVCVHDAIYI